MIRLITERAELDALFDHYAERFGRDQTPYRNHVYRVINRVAAQRPLSDDDLRKVELAGFFHDAGIWLAGTFDYLGPSARLASAAFSTAWMAMTTPAQKPRGRAR